MWDWELLKNGSCQHQYKVFEQYKNESFQFTHVITHGTEKDLFYLHNHAMYELVYCLSGNVAYMAEGVRYALEPGSLLIIGPTVLHRLFVCSDAPFERYILYINYLDKASPLSSLITACQPPIGKDRIGSAYYSAQDMAELSADFERIIRVCQSDKDKIKGLTPNYVQSLLSDLLIICEGKKPAASSVGDCTTSNMLVQYINANYFKDITLQDIADRFFLSKDYCNRLFKKTTGVTIMQYVLYNRIFCAKQLLAKGCSAVETAQRVGFSDYSSFFRAYRKITGRSPRDDYRLAEDISQPPEELMQKEEQIEVLRAYH